VLFAELTRICNHMLNIGSHAWTWAPTPNLWLFEIREDCLNFFERASGARMHSAWFRPGGVHQDVPLKLLTDIGDWLDTRLPQLFEDAMSLLTDNRIFKQRNVDIAVVSKEDAIRWGFSGVMIRGSGIAWDLRKAQPYDVYDRMDFDIPSAPAAIAMIVSWCAWRDPPVRADHEAVPAEMPEGGQLDRPQGGPAQRGEMKSSMESLIHHFKLYSEGFHVPAGEVYVATEAPKGEFGVYLVSDGTNKPYRCKIRRRVQPPSGDGLHVQGPHAARRDRDHGTIDVVFGSATGEQPRRINLHREGNDHDLRAGCGHLSPT
jgi:NADH-quinone oxidoreductase subunit D